jgi:hypothetical protein
MLNWKGSGLIEVLSWYLTAVMRRTTKDIGGSPWGDMNLALPKYILKHYYLLPIPLLIDVT